MSEGNTTPAGWYPSEGQMRYWDGTQWTEHTAPAQGTAPSGPTPGAGGPGGPNGPGGSNTDADRPFWKKKRFIVPAAVVLIIIIAAAASSGGSGSEDAPTASDTKSSAPKDSGKKSEDKPTKAATETADDKPEPDDGTKPSFDLPKQNGDWRLDQMQLKDDGLGEFGGVGRITYTGDDQDGGDNIFTVTVFSKDGNTILATLQGSANSVKPGQTVTTQFISGDPYKVGKFPFTFQNDL